jgi:RNA polymerase subunit RPABC4/transcription elongation factor Spt4
MSDEWIARTEREPMPDDLPVLIKSGEKSYLVIHSSNFLGQRYPQFDYWHKITPPQEKCPNCGRPLTECHGNCIFTPPQEETIAYSSGVVMKHGKIIHQTPSKEK